MTMTRFRQFPMECVTGDTRCRIMYDTCRAADTYIIITLAFALRSDNPQLIAVYAQATQSSAMKRQFSSVQGSSTIEADR